MPDINLTAEELAALDLLINVMKSNVGGGEVPGGFINDVIRVVGRVVDVAERAIPVIRVATALLGAGGPSDAVNNQLRELADKVPAGVTLDQLVELRRRVVNR